MPRKEIILNVLLQQRQEDKGGYLSFSARAGIIYQLHDYFQLVYMKFISK